jgi:CO/xanthine dehydrogenase Mo-binding subunit
MYEKFDKIDPYTKEHYPQSIYHDSKNLKYVGKPMLREGAPGRLLAREVYSNDVLLSRMLYLKVLRSPYSHAKIKSIDVTKAKALKGVAIVLTNADAPNLMNAAPYAYCINKEAWTQGDIMAAVAAEEEDIAEEALNLISVQYEVLPFILDQDAALKEGAYKLHGDTNEIGSAAIFKRGDVNGPTGFSAADKVITTEFKRVITPFQGVHPVASVENESMVASWENDRMYIWSSTQAPWGDARAVATAIGIPYNRVVAMNCRMGTGFGNKGSDGAGKKIAAYMSWKLHRPVKWYQDNDGYFNMQSSAWTCQHHNIKTGIKNDGTLVAFQDICTANGGYRGARAAEGGMEPIPVRLKCPNMYLEGHDAYTNSQSAGVPRCVPHPSTTDATSLNYEMCAEALKMDPSDFILKNMFTGSGVGTHPDKPEYDIGANPCPDFYKQLIDKSGWKNKWKGWDAPMSVNGSKRRGIGTSVHNCRHGALSNPESATVMLEPDGSCRVVTGSQECGNGWRTAATLMAAEEMGITPDKVKTPNFNTDLVQESKSPGGSTVTRGTGTAIILACRDAKEQLFKITIAAKKLAATNPDELETSENNVYLKADPTKKVGIADICALMGGQLMTSPTGYTYGGPIIGRGSYVTGRNATMMMMQWSGSTAEVEVDTDTGEVTVQNIILGCGVGRDIFHMGNYNQIIGGMAMMIGDALFAGLFKDEPTGIDLNPNYLMFKPPTFMDMPASMDVVMYEEIEPYGPFGAKGTGEPVMPSTTPSIINAIYNALGGLPGRKRITSVMATPDKVLAAAGKI